MDRTRKMGHLTSKFLLLIMLRYIACHEFNPITALNGYLFGDLTDKLYSIFYFVVC